MTHQLLIKTKILFLLLSVSLFSQTLTQVSVEGNIIFESSFYENIVTNNLSLRKEELQKKIITGLSRNGYYNSIIHEFRKDSTNNLVYLRITEGSPTYISKIIVDTLQNYDRILLEKHFSLLEDQIFIESELETKISELLNNLEDEGYPFAKIKINSIQFKTLEEENLVDVYLNLNTNKLMKIDKVEIFGNTKTSNDVIINSTRLTKGQLYSQSRIDNIPILLKKLRFFKSVNTPQYFVNRDNEGILRIEVEEKNTNSFDGIVGYVPAANEQEDGFFTGFVNVNLRNLFGTGRSLAIKWQQENSLSQELELKYLEPWILDYPFNINLNFYQRRQDSSYVKRIIGGSIEYLATENISASVIVESESIIPNINNSTLFKSSSLNSGIQLKLDYRDDIIAPTSGIYFSSIYKFRSKNISNSSLLPDIINNGDLEYHNYELSFGLYYEIFTSQIIALGVNAKEIIGDFYDISDYFQLGGTNSLRGYRENQFLGNRIMWSNLEYRFLLSQASYVFAFYDTGYFLISDDLVNDIKRTSNYLNGYGVGISLETGLGIMRVSYAFAEGTSISSGLIHFGILNEF